MELYLRIPPAPQTFSVQHHTLSCDGAEVTYKETISKFSPSVLSQLLDCPCILSVSPKSNWSTTKILARSKLHNHFNQITALTAIQVTSCTTYIDLFDTSKNKKLSNSISMESQLRKRPILHKTQSQTTVDSLFQSVTTVVDPVIITFHSKTRKFSIVNISLEENFDQYELVYNILRNKRSMKLEDVIPRFIFKLVSTRNCTKTILTLDSCTDATIIREAISKLTTDKKLSQAPSNIPKPKNQISKQQSHTPRSPKSHITRPQSASNIPVPTSSSHNAKLPSAISAKQPPITKSSDGATSSITTAHNPSIILDAIPRCYIEPPLALPQRILTVITSFRGEKSADIYAHQQKQLSNLWLQIHSLEQRGNILRTSYTNKVNELVGEKLEWNQLLSEFNYQHVYNFSDSRVIEANKIVIREKASRQHEELLRSMKGYSKFTSSSDPIQSLFNAKMKLEIIARDNAMVENLVQHVVSERNDYENKICAAVNNEAYRKEIEKMRVENDIYCQNEGTELDSSSDTIAESVSAKSWEIDCDLNCRLKRSIDIDELSSVSDLESIFGSDDWGIVTSSTAVDKTTENNEYEKSEVPMNEEEQEVEAMNETKSELDDMEEKESIAEQKEPGLLRDIADQMESDPSPRDLQLESDPPKNDTSETKSNIQPLEIPQPPKLTNDKSEHDIQTEASIRSARSQDLFLAESHSQPLRKSSKELSKLREKLVGNVSKWAQKYEQLSAVDCAIPKPRGPKFSALDGLRFSATNSGSRVSSNSSAKLDQVD